MKRKIEFDNDRFSEEEKNLLKYITNSNKANGLAWNTSFNFDKREAEKALKMTFPEIYRLLDSLSKKYILKEPNTHNLSNIKTVKTCKAPERSIWETR